MGARLFFVLAISLLTLTPAQGRAEESCTQAKDLVKAVKAFYGNKADLTDTIDPQLNINLKGINGQPLISLRKNRTSIAN